MVVIEISFLEIGTSNEIRISSVVIRTKNEIRVFCSNFVFGKQSGKRDGSVHTRILIKDEKRG